MGVYREGKKGRGATAPQSQEMHSYSISGAERGAGLYPVGLHTASRATDPVHHTTRMDIRGAVLPFFCGNDKTDKEQSDVCHQMSFNVSLSQHDSPVSTGTSTRPPRLASCEDRGWQAPGCWLQEQPQASAQSKHPHLLQLTRSGVLQVAVSIL